MRSWVFAWIVFLELGWERVFLFLSRYDLEDVSNRGFSYIAFKLWYSKNASLNVLHKRTPVENWSDNSQSVFRSKQVKVENSFVIWVINTPGPWTINPYKMRMFDYRFNVWNVKSDRLLSFHSADAEPNNASCPNNSNSYRENHNDRVAFSTKIYTARLVRKHFLYIAWLKWTCK